jgi:hypothetical protein
VAHGCECVVDELIPDGGQEVVMILLRWAVEVERDEANVDEFSE